MDEKAKQNKSEVPNNVLSGNIPGSDARVYFKERAVAGKGDCGFIAIGYDRREVADTLYYAAQEDSEAIWEEIYEAFQTSTIKRTETFQSLYDAFQDPFIDEETREGIRVDLEAYCKRREVYEYYINNYHQKLWLGYKSALLFGKLIGMSVYVWKKDNKNNLTIINSVVSPEDKGLVVHMLLTGRYTHYNLLVETSAPHQIANVNQRIVSVEEVVFNPDDAAHVSFAQRISGLTTEELNEIFVEPAKKVEPRKGLGNLNRAFIVGNERNARSERGQEAFDEMSSLVLSLFPELTVPFLNAELKQILAKTQQFHSQNEKKETENKVSFKINLKERVLAKEKDEASVTTNTSSPKPAGIPDVQKTDVHQAPKKQVAHDIKRFENIHPMVDAVEGSILDSVKNLGFTKLEKDESTRKLIAAGNVYIEIAKDGSMESKMEVSSNIEEAAKEGVKRFIAMVTIYHEIAKKYGKDLAFPSGELEMEIESDSKDLAKIKELMKTYLKEKFSRPPLSWISDKFIFDGVKFNSEITSTSDKSLDSVESENLKMTDKNGPVKDDFKALREIRDREAEVKKTRENTESSAKDDTRSDKGLNNDDLKPKSSP